MIPRYHVRPSADLHLDGQAEYLAREASIEAALRFYDAAASTFENLARTPGVGERRESSNPRLAGLRVWRIDGFPKHPSFIGSSTMVSRLSASSMARDIDSVLEGENID
jgi:toxin ParE1/3/4